MSKKKGLFKHLAWNGIKSNSKLYLPYILAAAGMTAMFYIITALSNAPFIKSVKGGSSAQLILQLGIGVIGVFAVIFMFYTNSFLIRTRTREFGLYNILGMSRRHIARIVAIETVIAAIFSTIGGILAGIMFEKLAEMLFMKLIGETADYDLSVDPFSIVITVVVFLSIFFLVMLRSMVRIFRLNTIELLKSENIGEKPPKAKWILTLLGVILLGGAYYLAVVMAAPIQAIMMFFVAVIMVILGTYILFISGSVSVCRGLQKNKKFYYQTKHIVSLSSMVYRMKRNGAGLASICILSTMVLVMISSTSCLYFGADASLEARYPKDAEFAFRYYRETSKEKIEKSKVDLIDAIDKAARNSGTKLSNVDYFSTKYCSYYINNGVLYSDEDVDLDSFSVADYGNIWDVYFIGLDDYNRYMGENRTLNEDEVICCIYDSKFKYDNLTINNGKTYKIVDKVKDFYKFGFILSNVAPSMVFIVDDIYSFDKDLSLKWNYSFDMELSGSEQANAYVEIYNAIRTNPKFFDDDNEYGISILTGENRFMNKADFFGMYGGLFFLGITLSIVFTCALVLILYYKQISEGYEDRGRYEIMRKVGMTDNDIRQNVNSQMSSVFYMPLAAAVLHLCFACPMIFSMLKLFSVTELSSLLITSVISVAGFAVIYTIVYKITSNSYYKLVR